MDRMNGALTNAANSLEIHNKNNESNAKRRDHEDQVQSGRAPIVGWLNSSASVLPSSPCKTPDSLDADIAISHVGEEDAGQAIKSIPLNAVAPCDEGTESKELLGENAANSSTTQLARDKAKKKRRKAEIPDGGWGWMVVLASLVISMIADGVSFSFGLLYIEFLKEFGASKSKTAWIGSLFIAVPLLSGPVMSALVDRYGCRKMTIAGGLISGFGFILSCFATSIEIMYLTFGVIAGLGLGLCYVTAVVSIAYWFDKKRTFAVGLGACGTGIGTFVYAPMTTYFIEEYGWRGTCLLLAGTFFNVIVCGAVMRDPEWWILEQRKQQLQEESSKKLADQFDENVAEENALRDPSVLNDGDCRGDGGGGADNALDHELGILLMKQHFSTVHRTSLPPRRVFRSAVNLPTFVKHSEKVPQEVWESLCKDHKLCYDVITRNYPNILEHRGNILDKDVAAFVRNGATETTGSKATELRVQKREGTSEKMATGEASSAFAEAQTDSLPLLERRLSANANYFNSIMCRGTALNVKKHRSRASSCPDIYKYSTNSLRKKKEEKWYKELVELLSGMIDFSMFLELHFLLMSLSTIFLFTSFIVPYFYLAEHLTRNGYSEADAANLLSIIGITNTIGMVALGWAGDQPWMHVGKTFAWCLAACGLATLLMSIVTPYYALLTVVSAAFGLFFASSFSFTPVILVELIPLERFTTAYGLTLLCQGIGNLVGPPLAGWLFDVTQSWDLSFLMAGGCIIVSGLFIGVIPYSRNRKIWPSAPIQTETKEEKEYV